MDLGIQGKRAIVCAASSGLGRACATALAREGVHVVINARDAGKLARTGEAIRAAAPEIEVIEVAGDVTLPETRDALAAAAPEADILVNNAGGPPPGDFRDWDRDTWIRALDANMLTGIDLIRRTIDGMAARGFGRIVNITSASVRVPIPVLGLSNGARAGLTNFVLGLAPSVADQGVTINNMLPGPFDTERMRKLAGAGRGLTGRMGDPDDFGAMCAFLCSRHAGYVTGQNIMLDGGQNPGNF